MTATVVERICARIVRHLSGPIEVLNHVPFGLDIVSRYRAYAVRNLTLLDKFVDPALFAGRGVSFRALIADAADCDLAALGPFNLGMARATLSLIPSADAKRAVTAKARACRTIVLNDVATDAPISRTAVRADKHTVHPFQKWLRDLGRDPRTTGWSAVDIAYNAMIVA